MLWERSRIMTTSAFVFSSMGLVLPVMLRERFSVPSPLAVTFLIALGCSRTTFRSMAAGLPPGVAGCSGS